MPPELQHGIWNTIVARFQVSVRDEDTWGVDDLQWWPELAAALARDFEIRPVDELPDDAFESRNWVKVVVYALSWNRVYDLLEFLVERVDAIKQNVFPGEEGRQLQVEFNSILERSRAGWSFVGGTLSPIRDPAEVSAVESALDDTARLGAGPAREHLMRAVELLGERPTPDCRNSVKESTCAVEAVACILCGDKSADLPRALRELERCGVEIHPAFKAASLKLYGYASDERGARHSLVGESRIDVEEARAVLTWSAGLVSYLLAKAARADRSSREAE